MYDILWARIEFDRPFYQGTLMFREMRFESQGWYGTGWVVSECLKQSVYHLFHAAPLSDLLSFYQAPPRLNCSKPAHDATFPPSTKQLHV